MQGPNWRHRFKLVVGVVHTNYIYYAQTMPGGGQIQAALLKPLNILLCKAYCDKVIKLSDALQPFPRAIVCNVHGVRDEFLDIGRRAGAPFHRFKRGAYFLGKVLWAKGHGFLIEYMKMQRAQARGHTRLWRPCVHFCRRADGIDHDQRWQDDATRHIRQGDGSSRRESARVSSTLHRHHPPTSTSAHVYVGAAYGRTAATCRRLRRW